MNKCIKCGSYAFNLYKEGIDQGGLCDVHYWQGRAHRAEALVQPEQEPTWYHAECDDPDHSGFFKEAIDAVTQVNEHGGFVAQLYTTPPQRTWVGLDDDEVREIYGIDLDYKDGDYARYARAIEAKLKEKNT